MKLGVYNMASEREGGITLPTKLGWTAVVGGFLFLGQQMYSEGQARTEIRRDIQELQRLQSESRERGNEIRRRLDTQDGYRIDLGNRLTRLEEQQRLSVQLLQEIREYQRNSPR